MSLEDITKFLWKKLNEGYVKLEEKSEQYMDNYYECEEQLEKQLKAKYGENYRYDNQLLSDEQLIDLFKRSNGHQKMIYASLLQERGYTEKV